MSEAEEAALAFDDDGFFDDKTKEQLIEALIQAVFILLSRLTDRGLQTQVGQKQVRHVEKAVQAVLDNN
jgi:Mor family transcriptional regulator